jgi:hypothetical protein
MMQVKKQNTIAKTYSNKFENVKESVSRSKMPVKYHDKQSLYFHVYIQAAAAIQQKHGDNYKIDCINNVTHRNIRPRVAQVITD